jgi:hypothetical protein
VSRFRREIRIKGYVLPVLQAVSVAELIAIEQRLTLAGGYRNSPSIEHGVAE